MIKILFLINTLGGGGAERVLVNLVNKLDRSKYDITVETMFGGGVNKELLAKDVNYINKNACCFRGISRIYRLIPARFLFKYFIGKTQYDVIVSYMHGAPAKVISGCKQKRVKKIVWLHNGDMINSNFFGFWLTKELAVKAYRSFDSIVGVANSVVKAFSDYTGIIDNIQVVYNTNDVARIRKQSLENVELPFKREHFLITSVGRIDSSKGYDRLIPIAKKLYDNGYRFDLVIVGQGKDYESLKQLVFDLDASDYIHLLGFRKNPYPLIAASDLFVSSSRFEGLSTVISEAIILGVPVLSTDVSGAKEVLGNNNEFGIVVENTDNSLYKGIKNFLCDPQLLNYYRKQAIKRSSFFDINKTVKQAEELIDSVANT